MKRFFASDTTGEKAFEEFFTQDEVLDMSRSNSIGVIKSSLEFDERKLDTFTAQVRGLKNAGAWTRADPVQAFNSVLPNFAHKETGRFLDDRM